MKSKSNERSQAIYLRMKGETIPDIARVLNVSKSSVSLWLRGSSLPIKAQKLLEGRRTQSRINASMAKRKMTLSKLEEARNDATAIANAYIVDSVGALVLCSLMYWCEGSKSKNDSEFTFTNADPITVAGFLSLFRKAFFLDESRFRVKMHLHPYHIESKQKKFWSQITGIPVTQFQGTFWKHNSGVSIKPDYPGCVHIRYHDVTVSRKISAVGRNFLVSLNVIK